MDVISPTFEFRDFLPLFIAFLVVFVVTLFVVLINDGKRGLVSGAGVGAIFGTLAAACFSPLLVSHHDNMVNDLQSRFETAYDLTIVDETVNPASIPLTPGDDAEAVKVFLHEMPGEQSIIVEIVDGKYVVTHDGEIREPVN